MSVLSSTLIFQLHLSTHHLIPTSLALLQLDSNRLTCILPLACLRIQIPVRQHEVGVLALFNLGRSRLQVLGIVEHLLPEVAFEVLVLAREHHVTVQVLRLQALQPVVLLSYHVVKYLLPRSFLSHHRIT